VPLRSAASLKEQRVSVELITPTLDLLPHYVAALERGWSADNVRGASAAAEELAQAQADPVAFVAAFVNRAGGGAMVTLPDGSQVERLPGYRLWIWDGEFCGTIGLRWQPGTTELPPHVLGHIGYAVVPWKRGRGHATRALALMLVHARNEGLPHVDLTTDPENLASQRVVLANGGTLIERFIKPAAYGGQPGLRFRVKL
jgi:predicted acetyltransferase